MVFASNYTKRLIFITFSNLLFLTFGLVTLELCFGNWVSPNRLNLLNIVRNVEIVLDVTSLYSISDTSMTYKRDQYGLRGQYDDPSQIDILTIGGSTTDQRYIGEGQTWQDILRKDFLSHGKKVSVVNAGVDGQSTHGHIKNFDWWFPQIPGFKPKHILFYVGINDLYFPESSKYDALFNANWLIEIKNRSALYYLFRTFTGMYLANVVYGIGHHRDDPAMREWVDVPEIENHEDLMRSRLVSYETRLKILLERVRQLDAIPIFVTQYSRSYKQHEGKVVGFKKFISPIDGVKLNGVDHYYLMNLINQKTMEVCQKSAAICADLANEVEFEDEDFYDPAHNSPRGAEKIGHFLYAKLLASL